MTEEQIISDLKDKNIEQEKHYMYKSRKYLIQMSYFTLALASAFILYIFYMTFYPFNIVELKGFKVDQESVRRGETVEYTLKFDKKMDIYATAEYFLIDGFVYKFDTANTTRPVGDQAVNRSQVIPSETPPGIYKLRIELEYHILPWRSKKYTWNSNEFRVE